MTLMSRHSFIARCLLVAVSAVPLALQAQDDKLTIHGSINMAYGKSDGLTYFGVPKDGTTDYRSVTLQFGYKISDADRVVVQLLNRKLGRSPLNAVTPEVQPVWAFYEHKFADGTAVKLGRSPIPRGLFNEVRFIGTLLPLYRVGGTGVYGETFEFLDGITVSKRLDLGGKFNLEAAAFAGGFPIKASLPTPTGIAVADVRQEGSIGGQLLLKLPIPGVRVGAFASSSRTPRTATDIRDRKRLNTVLFSAEADYEHAFLRGEYQAARQAVPDFTRVSGWYVHGGVRPSEAFTITAEYGALDSRLRFAAPVPNDLDIPAAREAILGAMWKPSAQVAFKLEGHRVVGYNFDSLVPSVVPPTGPPFRVSLAPASKAFFALASVAVSF